MILIETAPPRGRQRRPRAGQRLRSTGEAGWTVSGRGTHRISPGGRGCGGAARDWDRVGLPTRSQTCPPTKLAHPNWLANTFRNANPVQIVGGPIDLSVG